MLTKDDLLAIGILLEPLNKRLEGMEKRLETLGLRIEAVHEFNKKAHAETMGTLLDIGEINYQELKKELKELKRRMEQLESKQQN